MPAFDPVIVACSRRRCLTVLVAVLTASFIALALPVGASAACATASWTGAADGSSWDNAGNWTCGIPDATTAVTIASGTGDPVIINNGDVAASIALSGTMTLTVDGGGLTVSGTTTVPSGTTLSVLDDGTVIDDGDLVMEGGALDLTEGTYDLQGASITSTTATGTVTIDPNGTLEHTGASNDVVQAAVNSTGTMDEEGTSGAGKLTLENGGSATADSPTIDDLDGTLTANGGTLAVSAQVDQESSTEFQGADGVLEIDGTWLSDGDMTFSGTSGTYLHIAASGVLQHDGANASTLAPPVVDDGIIDLASTSTSNWTFAPGPTIVHSDGAVNVESQELELFDLSNLAPSASNASDNVLKDGTYTLEGTLLIQDQINELAASIEIAGAGGVLAGTIGGSGNTTALQALTTIDANHSLTFTGGHADSASLTGIAGQLTLAGTSSLNVNGKTTTVESGGTLTGTGTLAGSVSNSGVVTPGGAGPSPGTLTVSGGFTQTATGQLDIAVAGTATGQYSALSVGGSATLGGTLAMEPTTGYAATAAAGDSVPFMPYTGTRSGTFSSVTSTPSLTSPNIYTADYEDAAKRISALVVVPPRNTSLPTISGNATQNQTLTAKAGTWTQSPTFSYQWQDCNASGARCSDIAGATSTTHELSAADVGHKLRMVVTATNAAGTATATSAPTAVVAALPKPKVLSLKNVRLKARSFTAKNGTKLEFTLNEAATVSLTVTKHKSGRIVHKRCKAGAKRGKRCTLTVVAKRLSKSAKAGNDAFVFRPQKLLPGSYRVSVTARVGKGKPTKAVVLRFTIKPRKRTVKHTSLRPAV